MNTFPLKEHKHIKRAPNYSPNITTSLIHTRNFTEIVRQP